MIAVALAALALAGPGVELDVALSRVAGGIPIYCEADAEFTARAAALGYPGERTLGLAYFADRAVYLRRWICVRLHWPQPTPFAVYVLGHELGHIANDSSDELEADRYSARNAARLTRTLRRLHGVLA